MSRSVPLQTGCAVLPLLSARLRGGGDKPIIWKIAGFLLRAVLGLVAYVGLARLPWDGELLPAVYSTPGFKQTCLIFDAPHQVCF
jgi:hypothetical protein